MNLNISFFLGAAVLCGALTTSTSASEYQLLEVKGTLRIKREGRDEFENVKSGDRMSLGDLLETGEGASALIQCAFSEARWKMLQNSTSGVNEGCPPILSLYPRTGQKTNISPGGTDPNIPYVISPRRTAVLDPKPILRWNPVEGTTQYTVGRASEKRGIASHILPRPGARG